VRETQNVYSGCASSITRKPNGLMRPKLNYGWLTPCQYCARESGQAAWQRGFHLPFLASKEKPEFFIKATASIIVSGERR